MDQLHLQRAITKLYRFVTGIEASCETPQVTGSAAKDLVINIGGNGLPLLLLAVVCLQRFRAQVCLVRGFVPAIENVVRYVLQLVEHGDVVEMNVGPFDWLGLPSVH